MKTPQPFSAVLLAGGQSTRMGSDKAALILDGEPLWQRQLAKLRETGADEVFISGRADGPYAGAGVAVVEDLTPGVGPLAGLQAAMRHARNPWLLVLAVDLPDVPAAFLRKLVSKAMTVGTGLVPSRAEWLQPTAAVYPCAAVQVVDECLAGENHSLRRLIRLARKRGLVEVRPVTAAEHAHFRNLNSPVDLTAPPA